LTAGGTVSSGTTFLYGTAAALVFPKHSSRARCRQLIALLASFSTFAVGLLARPIGGIIGHYGVASAATSAGRGARADGYRDDADRRLPRMRPSVWRPLPLIVLRFAQGIAIGGQWRRPVDRHRECSARRRLLRQLCTGRRTDRSSANLAFPLMRPPPRRMPSCTGLARAASHERRAHRHALFVQRLEDTVGFSSCSEAAASSAGLPRRRRHARQCSKRCTHPKQIALAAGAPSVQVPFYILIALGSHTAPAAGPAVSPTRCW
jgi:hypothetical protein